MRNFSIKMLFVFVTILTGCTSRTSLNQSFKSGPGGFVNEISRRLFGLSSSGNTYFVATDGDDSNSGDINSPVLTIQHCISLMSAGDTCYVRGGTYSTNTGANRIGGFYGLGPDNPGTTVVPHGTSWDNAITIAAYPGETVNLVCTNGSGIAGWSTDTFPNRRDFYWIVDGFHMDMTNTPNGTPPSYLDSTPTISDLFTSHIRIQNCELKNSYTVGMLITGQYWELLNVDVHDNGLLAGMSPDAFQPFHGVYFSYGSDILIDGGSYHDNGGYGIHFNTEGHDTNNNNIVRNTKVYNNNLITFRTGGGGIAMTAGGNDLAYNNLIYNNGGAGLQFSGLQHASGPSFGYNNTIVGNGIAGVLIGQAKDGTIIRNNIIYGNDNDIVDNAPLQGHTSIIDHNLMSDPRFANGAAGDFHLLPDSPAIDAGLYVPEVTTDLDGAARYAGLGYDIGAYEFGGIAADPTPTPIPTVTPANDYSCEGGIVCDGTPVTGAPDQVVCGTDLMNYSCTSSGWQQTGSPCKCSNRIISSVTTECRIDVPSCPDHPEAQGSNISDDYDGSGGSELRCMQRAQEYYDWCGTSDPVTAHYLSDGVEVDQYTYPPTSSLPSAYSCEGGTVCDGTPVTGSPDQVVCGTDLMNYACTAYGWQQTGSSCSCDTFSPEVTILSISPAPIVQKTNLSTKQKSRPSP